METSQTLFKKLAVKLPELHFNNASAYVWAADHDCSSILSLSLITFFSECILKPNIWAFSGIANLIRSKGHGESQADEMKNVLVVLLYREIFMQFYHIERKKVLWFSSPASWSFSQKFGHLDLKNQNVLECSGNGDITWNNILSQLFLWFYNVFF